MRLLRRHEQNTHAGRRARPSAGERMWEELRVLDLARATAVPVPEVDAWLAGARQPSGPARERLAGLARLLDELEAAGMVEADGRAEWLRGPNAAFGGDAPLDVLASGEGARLRSYIAALS